MTQGHEASSYPWRVLFYGVGYVRFRRDRLVVLGIEALFASTRSARILRILATAIRVIKSS